MYNHMKVYCPQLLVLLVMVVAFSSCASPKPTVYPPAPLPDILVSVPQQAKVRCFNDPAIDERGTVWLWSLPGRGLPDSDSGISGHRGNTLGEIEFCEPIQITDSYWDPYNAEYWAKIEVNDLVGWLPVDLIAVE